MSSTKGDMSHLPLCECANSSAYCLGKQPNVACMAHDDWYTVPAQKHWELEFWEDESQYYGTD